MTDQMTESRAPTSPDLEEIMAMSMRERLDPLIAERAPWMYRDGMVMRPIRGALHLLLGYDKALKVGEQLRHWDSPTIMDFMADMIARKTEISGLENIPASGRAMIVSNHPTGIADGIILWKLIAQRRPDMFFFANADALRILPQLREIIAPVEWREDKRSHAQNRETLAYAKDAAAKERLAVIFPSGRLAKRRRFRLHEREWMASAAMMARKFNMPVIPMHMTARNSALFYLFDKLHPTLRDITLFHEVLNKDKQRYKVELGTPIDPSALPQGSVEATEFLKQKVLSLPQDRNQSLLEPGSTFDKIERALALS
ncbi:1-acyl-sn-glycerol-3-phosphate acyltransferase [Paracoccaceae bacterium GXU_MW_L88]